jgi:hypothetical protein
MAGSKVSMFLAITALLFTSFSILEVNAGPNTVTGSILILGQFDVVIREDETLPFDVEGFFSVTKDVWDIGTYATMSVELNVGDWEPALSQTRWETVQQDETYDLMVSVTIPNGSLVGEQSSYTLILTIYNNLDQEVGSDTEGFSIDIKSVIPTGDDDDSTADDEIITPIEDESFPLWPIFIIVIVIGLIIVGIWARKNLEFIREEDGSRRIMLREKDSGHILGRKKQPPPEIEL